MTTDFKIEDCFLKVTGDGEYSIEELKTLFSSIISLSHTKNISKAIIDLRHVTGQCLKFENYKLFSDLHKLLSELNHPLHIAFCANGNILQDASFVNQIASSVNPSFKTEQNYDQVFTWLETIDIPCTEKTIR